MSEERAFYSLNSAEICAKYAEFLTSEQQKRNFYNAVVRYFVPSIQGPDPAMKKSIPITSEHIQVAFNFLEEVPLFLLANAPELASNISGELNYSTTQQVRIRHDLRGMIDWSRKHGYLPEPENAIPDGTCSHVKVGQFQGLSLRTANTRQIVEEYLEQLKDRGDKSDTTNAIVRFFVRGCKGPIPYHQPALEIEKQAAFKFLEATPLEYLNEAVSIAIPAMKVLGLSRVHQTLVRKSLRKLVKWAREKSYLPDPCTVAPWGGEAPSQTERFLQQEVQPKQCSLLESYQSYCQDLEKNGKTPMINSLQSMVIRYLVPAYGGPIPKSKKATPDEVRAGLSYLEAIPLTCLGDALNVLDVQLNFLQVPHPTRASIRSRLRSWQNWSAEHQKPNTKEVQEMQPIFRTFYTPGNLRKRKKPGQEMHQDRCPPHALCAKEFPKDYINSYLQQQLDGYGDWRRADNVRPVSIKTELEQIHQILGWLLRYEGVSLEELRFERVVAKTKLTFSISDYPGYYEYLMQKEAGIQEAGNTADQDKQRIERYLSFVGKNPRSQSRRLFIVITVAKFLYRDLVGTDAFPKANDIPILRRLLDYQRKLKGKNRTVLETIPYSETSVSWEEAINAMEQERRRADTVFVFMENKKLRKGYVKQQRPAHEIADDLQRFLSIALLLLIPSRPRTFYELRIGETLKEGIAGRRFQSVEELKHLGVWEQLKDQVKFYVHHLPDDYKTGKSMEPALINAGGWWGEVPNLVFGETCLYDYIYRWLNWGREINGSVSHNFFFRRDSKTEPIDNGAWNNRIKRIFERGTGVPVPPKNVRKMFTTEFPEHTEAGALLLQHSVKAHMHNYDMRCSLKKMQPVVEANVRLIEGTLEDRDEPAF